jgi:cytochrome-b5 reductase
LYTHKIPEVIIVAMEFKVAGINNNKVHEKVAIKPGFHLVDWNRLMRSMTTTAFGVDSVTISVEELARHNTKYDCWVAYKGKVYNITQYLAYHPGGEEIVLEWAGKDCTEQYDLHHRWVNIKATVGKCQVGCLESASIAEWKSEGGNESRNDKSSPSDAKSVLSERTDTP